LAETGLREQYSLAQWSRFREKKTEKKFIAKKKKRKHKKQ
jgi:hypothetical protein